MKKIAASSPAGAQDKRALLAAPASEPVPCPHGAYAVFQGHLSFHPESVDVASVLWYV
jgi:hypothetical protein